MKVVGLISGGKDSIMNLIECVAHGHEIICLANLHGETVGEELDSFMYQTVGVEIAPLIAECMELPLVLHQLKGKSVNTELYYEKSEEVEETDEVEDLTALLVKVKEQYPEVQAVASGAIFSNYQRLRVENVCQRLGLFSLAYLWNREQSNLLNEMIESEMDGRLVKVCSMGLKEVHLGKSITQLASVFEKFKDQFGFNVCGEGGEYESAVFDCPLFKTKRIKCENQKIVPLDDNNDKSMQVAILVLEGLELEEKDSETIARHAEIMEKRTKAVETEHGEEVKEDTIPFEEPDDIVAESIEEIKVSTVPQTDLALSDQMFYSGAVTSRIGKQILQTDEREKSLENDIEDLNDILANLTDQLIEKGMTLKANAVYVDLKVRDMATFATLNKLYVESFGLKPPVRVCVQPVSAEKGCVSMAVLALSNDKLKTRKNLHVQSFSTWAPANIGPYSQANLVGSSQFIMLAGQIGLNPGLMNLRPSLSQQFDQIIRNYNSTLREILQSKDEDADLIEQTCVKAILYISRETCINDELSDQIDTLKKHSMPVTILRVNTLPKNAPLELEMVAVPHKQELKQHRPNEANIVLEKDGDIQYLFARFDSLEDFLRGDLDLFSKQEPKEGRDAILRVDVYHPVNLTLDPSVKMHIRRLDNTVYSFIPVLDCLHAKSLDQMKQMTNTSGLVITVEYIQLLAE